MIHADEISKTIQVYLQRHPDEAVRLAAVTAALAEPGDPTSRKTFSGHATCSAIVLDPTGRVLHIRHNALNMWLCPGGHLEDGDTSLIEAARREVAEETGIPAGGLTLLGHVPVDVDVHLIPANPAKGEPAHPHFDLRYAFATDRAWSVTLQAGEVHDAAWLPIEQLEPTALRQKVLRVRPNP